MTTRVMFGGDVIAERTEDPSVMRCVALLTDGVRSRVCGVIVQRTTNGDLVDGVRAHYKLCHPERKL